MKEKYFEFKNFTLSFNNQVMPVNTDGILIAAWAKIPNKGEVLDVGTGSGLISLITAQKSKSKINAIDLLFSAIECAQKNIKTSAYNDRIEVIHSSMQDFKPTYLFDAIVSNPPFFSNSLKPDSLARKSARHTDDVLSWSDFFIHSFRLLKEKGKLNFIAPYDQKEMLFRMADKFGFYPEEYIEIADKEGMPFKRIMMCFTKEIHLKVISKTLYIRKDKETYSDDFFHLTKDYYKEIVFNR